MAVIESQLVGDQRLTLHIAPTPLAERIKRVEGITSVNLWTVPWEADLFAAALRRFQQADTPPYLLPRVIEESLFWDRTPLVTGRRQHFRGQFANSKLLLMQAKMRETKSAASFWLGLVHYEGQQFDVAADWLRVRTLEATRDSRWVTGAQYNLARCYEKLGRSVDARVIYLEDQSPQRHGNLLRARRLAELDTKSG